MSRGRVIVATGNCCKLREISEIMTPAGYECVSLRELGKSIDNVLENGNTFLENARIKARAAKLLCGGTVLADDSGLCVDALDGAPGVHTARYAGEGKNNDDNIDLLLKNLKGIKPENRTARFVCCVVAITEEGLELYSYGTCEGRIGDERLGDGGFGYDPVFRLYNNMSLGEVSEEYKNRISHRARALRKMAFMLRNIIKIRGIK